MKISWLGNQKASRWTTDENSRKPHRLIRYKTQKGYIFRSTKSSKKEHTVINSLNLSNIKLQINSFAISKISLNSRISDLVPSLDCPQFQVPQNYARDYLAIFHWTNFQLQCFYRPSVSCTRPSDQFCWTNWSVLLDQSVFFTGPTHQFGWTNPSFLLDQLISLAGPIRRFGWLISPALLDHVITVTWHQKVIPVSLLHHCFLPSPFGPEIRSSLFCKIMNKLWIILDYYSEHFSIRLSWIQWFPWAR